MNYDKWVIIKGLAVPGIPIISIIGLILIIGSPPNLSDQIEISSQSVVHLRMSGRGQGSGFVVGPRLIATAKHCVQGVSEFLITTNDGHQLRATKAISSKEHDVAFIWVDDLTCVANERGTKSHQVVLQPLSLGPIAKCRLGESVYTVGSPFGAANFNAVSLGIISGIGRDWSEYGASYGWEIAFTVDSPGAPGNSGCPVFSKDGIVRGVLVGGLSPSHVCVMPCELFLDDIRVIRNLFLEDEYQMEALVVRQDEYYQDEVYQ